MMTHFRHPSVEECDDWPLVPALYGLEIAISCEDWEDSDDLFVRRTPFFEMTGEHIPGERQQQMYLCLAHEFVDFLDERIALVEPGKYSRRYGQIKDDILIERARLARHNTFRIDHLVTRVQNLEKSLKALSSTFAGNSGTHAYQLSDSRTNDKSGFKTASFSQEDIDKKRRELEKAYSSASFYADTKREDLVQFYKGEAERIESELRQMGS